MTTAFTAACWTKSRNGTSRDLVYITWQLTRSWHCWSTWSWQASTTSIYERNHIDSLVRVVELHRPGDRVFQLHSVLLFKRWSNDCFTVVGLLGFLHILRTFGLAYAELRHEEPLIWYLVELGLVLLASREPQVSVVELRCSANLIAARFRVSVLRGIDWHQLMRIRKWCGNWFTFVSHLDYWPLKRENSSFTECGELNVMTTKKCPVVCRTTRIFMAMEEVAAFPLFGDPDVISRTLAYSKIDCPLC